MQRNLNVLFHFSWKWSIYENCSNELRITFLYCINVCWCQRWACLVWFGKAFAHQATGKTGHQLANTVIPITRSMCRQNCSVPSPHVSTRFPCFSIRLTRSPVPVFRNGEIGPDEASHARVPLKSNPNHRHWWCTFVNQLQHKLVFFVAVYLHQFPSQSFAVRLGLVPSLDGASHKVTVAFKLHPAPGTMVT